MIKFLKKHFHLKYGNVYIHAKKLFIFDIGLLILAFFMLATSVFFFFWKPTLVDLVDVKFSFGGERLVSGEEMTITINYTNRSKQTLKNAEMAIHLPKGFVTDRQKTPLAEFSDQSIFTLNDIKSGATGQRQIQGIWYAEPGVDNTISAYLTYIPEEKTDKEQKRSSAIMRAVDSVLNLEISLPDKTFPNEKIPITIKITNTGKYLLDKVNLKTFWTENFTGDQNDDFSLKSGETKEFTGAITAPAQAGEYDFAGLTSILINNESINQVNFSQKFTVFYPELYITASLSDDGKGYLEPGDKIPLTISWQNKSDFDLNNLKITLNFEPSIVNLSATARENNLTFTKDSLIIDKKSRTAMANGAPGGQDNFTISLILSSRFNLTGKNVKFKSMAQISAEISGIPSQTFSRQTESNSIPLTTEVVLDSEIRYYTPTGDQIGRGPLPPQVGEETKYWSINRIYNSTNEIKDLTFTAKLADGVKLGEKQSVTLGNKLTYDAAKNIVSWSYDSAPENSEIGLFFELSVTPNELLAGQNIKLIESVDFSATDAVAGKKFNLSQKNIFNILPADDQGSKNGSKVVR